MSELLKGMGGLQDCPKCKAIDSIKSIDKSWIDNEYMLNEVECSKCGTKFSETWNCRCWEEVKASTDDDVEIEIEESETYER